MATITLTLSAAAVTRIQDAYTEIHSLKEPADAAFVKEQIIRNLKRDVAKAERRIAQKAAGDNFVDPTIT